MAPQNESGAGGIETYTIEDVKKHRLKGDIWTVVHDQVYDISEFVPNHPGGDMIIMSGGYDSTVIFNCYHFSVLDKVKKVIKSYKIGEFKGKPSTNMGEHWPKMCKAVAKSLEGVEKRPLHSQLSYFFDLISFIVIIYYSWFHLSPETSSMWVICAVWMVQNGITRFRFTNQAHAFGHYHLFTPRVTEWLDPIHSIFNATQHFEYQLVTTGNIRQKLHEPTPIAGPEFTGLPKMPRGPYGHQTIHHVRGGAQQEDSCRRGITHGGFLRNTAEMPHKWYHSYQAHWFYQMLIQGFLIQIMFFIKYFIFRVNSLKINFRAGEWGPFLWALLATILVTPGFVWLEFVPFLYDYHHGTYIGSAAWIFMSWLLYIWNIQPLVTLFWAQHAWDTEFKDEEVETNWLYYNLQCSHSYQPHPSNWWKNPLYWFHGDCQCGGTLTYHLEHTIFPGINYCNLSKIAGTVEQVCNEVGYKYNKFNTLEELEAYKQDMLKKYSVPPSDKKLN